MIYYQEPNATIYQGHALEELRGLPAESVDMCMTSPPYWGLRSYKTEPMIWDSKDGCGHEWVTEIFKQHAGRGDCQSSKKYSAQEPIPDMKLDRQFCTICGAWRGELGLEPTIELYINHLLLIFDEVKRVLKTTGTCWVNIDDSYSGSGGTGNQFGQIEKGIGIVRPVQNLASKSLCLIPQRFAIAMVENGWILRNDIVWNKPNPMPESVKDRFTGSWEHLFFFVKSNSVQYWTNPVTGAITDRQPLGTKGEFDKDWVYRKLNEEGKIRQRVSLWQGHTYFFEQQFEKEGELTRRSASFRSGGAYTNNQCFNNSARIENRTHGDGEPSLDGRNKRDVWEITTQPYPEAHFATFPEKLCETPILAGCPSMICNKCGKARERIYEKTGHVNKREPAHQPGNTPTKVDSTGWGPTERPTTEYTVCGCNAGWTSGAVLDPFMGSGTTLAVAKRLGRKSIGIDISENYCKLSVKRIQGISLPMELNV